MTGTFADRLDRGASAAAIGILGGTFNPPHIAHLICAQAAIDQLRLARVLLMPVGMPPHKRVSHQVDAQTRAHLCRLAAADNPLLQVATIELDRGGPSYTVDTLRLLRERSPDDDLVFIVGGDSAYGLPSWREPEQVLSLARLAVADRGGIGRNEILDRLSSLPGVAERISFFDLPRIDISSSLVRSRAAVGSSIRYLVPDTVAAYITENRLYVNDETI